MNVHELRGFGAKVAAEAVRERTFAGMTPEAWKQTAKDMPFVIGAGAVGWGVGKTIADAVASRHAGPVMTQGAQYAPMIGNIIGMAASYTAGRMRAELQQRRNEAAKTAEDKKRAILITGNPKYIEGSPRAGKFYSKIEKVLAEAGYDVARNAGEPYTQPEDAELWVGHSRGADRLRFAGPGTKTVALGVSDGLAHPKDSAAQGGAPNKYHYKLTPAMMGALRGEVEKTSGWFPLTAKQRAAGQADFEARSAASEEQNKQRIIGLYMKHGPSLDDYHLEDHEARPETTMTRAEAEKHYNSTPKSPSGG